MRVWRHGEAFGRGNMVVRSECRCSFICDDGCSVFVVQVGGGFNLVG